MRDLNTPCEHRWEVKTIDSATVNSLISSTVTMCSLCGYIGQSVPITNPTWSIDKPTVPGWYWYRKGPTNTPEIIYSGVNWDAIVDFAGLAEPVTFERDHLLNGEWAGPLEPPT